MIRWVSKDKSTIALGEYYFIEESSESLIFIVGALAKYFYIGLVWLKYILSGLVKGVFGLAY